MEHSLREYLKRQSSEKLACVLQEYFASENWQVFDYAISDIMEVLLERENQEVFFIPIHIRQKWEEYLKQTEKGQAE